jgi:hypothetical protein
VLWVNGRLIGATLPHSFFRVHLNPGKQLLVGSGIDNGSLALETRPGEAYFVRLQVAGSHSRFEPVSAGNYRPVAVCWKTGAQASTPCFDSRIPR